MTVLLVISTFVLAITLMIIYQHKRFLETYREELVLIIRESQTVKADLEILLGQAVQLSGQMVNTLEHQVYLPHPDNSGDISDSIDHQASLNPIIINSEEMPLNINSQAAGKPDQQQPDLPILYHQVRDLFQQGHSVKEIARTLNRGQGEVNLVLNLTNKSKAI